MIGITVMYQFDQPLLTVLEYNVIVHYDNFYHFQNDIETKQRSLKSIKYALSPFNELFNNRSLCCLLHISLSS